MITEIIKSKFFLGLAAIAFVMVLVFLGKELYRRYEVVQEVKKLEQEIAALESSNASSMELIKYLQTIEYQERQARSLLSLQKPGEFAVRLPYQDEHGTQAESGNSKESNFKKWWMYFFTPSQSPSRFGGDEEGGRWNYFFGNETR